MDTNNMPAMPPSAPLSLTDAMASITAWRLRHPGVDYDKEPDHIWEIRREAMRRLSALKVGDTDPWLDRQIRIIIRKSTRYIVYLDDKYEIQWWWLQRPKDAITVGLVQARTTQLVHESGFLLLDNDLRSPMLSLRRRSKAGQQPAFPGRKDVTTHDVDTVESIRSQLGEAMALAIEGQPLANCERVLGEAEKSILVAKDQLCRTTFFWNFLLAVALVAAAVFLLWRTGCHDNTCRNRFVLGWAEAALAGAFGAFISAMLRTKELRLEPRAARRGIRIDAIARASIGAGAGIVMSFAYDSGLILKGLINPGAEAGEAFRLFLCVIAGISERMLPSLVGRAESLVDHGADKDKPPATASGKTAGADKTAK
jgi:hypothetical protein